MEPARDLLARPLPHLLYDGGTESPSIHGSPVSATFFTPWPSFYENVHVALQSMNLDEPVSLIESRNGEHYLTGSEPGLTARFVRNLCDPVSEALSVTHLHDIMFGDIHSVRRTTTEIPDLVMVKLVNPEQPNRATTTLVLVGEMKTWWTLELELFPVSSPVEELAELERPVGQVIRYMRKFNLKYGFLSTYRSTIFIRRAADYKFEISPPIDYRATGPSLRECFMAFAALANNDRIYTEPPGYNTRLLSISGIAGLQNSMRESYYRNHTIPQHVPTTLSSFNSRTIMIGQGGEAKAFATCVNILDSLTPGKAIMEVNFAGHKAVAKYWSEEFQESYKHEKAFYDAMTDRYPEGSAFFPSLLAYGEVVCSSLVAGGNVMIISWEDGERLSDLWQTLSQPDRIYIRNKCREAVAIIRQLNIYLQDSRKQNVLYERRTGKVTMLDFEHYGMCTPRHLQSLDAPELLTIFGRSGMSQITGG